MEPNGDYKNIGGFHQYGTTTYTHISKKPQYRYHIYTRKLSRTKNTIILLCAQVGYKVTCITFVPRSLSPSLFLFNFSLPLVPSLPLSLLLYALTRSSEIRYSDRECQQSICFLFNSCWFNLFLA